VSAGPGAASIRTRGLPSARLLLLLAGLFSRMSSAASVTSAVPSGANARLGIIGGGQLARMTALAAAPLGVDVTVIEKAPLSPGAQVVHRSVTGDWSDPLVLARFAQGLDVITLENEFIDAGLLRGHE